MKRKSMVYALLMALLCIGCQGDDEGSTQQSPDIEGRWNLVSVTGGFLGSEDLYDRGVIIWDFTDHEVQVTNHNTNPESIDIYESGTYDFILDTTAIPLTIVIGEVSYVIDTFTDSELIFGNEFADGYRLQLVR